jgi:predicted secreted protein
VIELRLAENPTTGFVWSFVTNGGPACAVVADSFAGPAGPPGAGGQHTWRFEGRQPGTCAIALVKRRPGQTTGAAQDFSLEVRVTR